MDAKFIKKITLLKHRTETNRKRFSELHQELTDLKRNCDHKDERGKLAVRVERRPYQRVCDICDEAVMGRENLSVYNSYITPARVKRVQKILKKVQRG